MSKGQNNQSVGYLDVFDDEVKGGDLVVFGGMSIHYANKYSTRCGLPFTRRFVIMKASPQGFKECKKCFKPQRTPRRKGNE